MFPNTELCRVKALKQHTKGLTHLDDMDLVIFDNTWDTEETDNTENSKDKNSNTEATNDTTTNQEQ